MARIYEEYNGKGPTIEAKYTPTGHTGWLAYKHAGVEGEFNEESIINKPTVNTSGSLGLNSRGVYGKYSLNSVPGEHGLSELLFSSVGYLATDEEGVYGKSEKGYGVRGESKTNFGVYGKSEKGSGVAGERKEESSNSTYDLSVITSGSLGHESSGVYGKYYRSVDSKDDSKGNISFSTEGYLGTEDEGVYGKSEGGYGVRGESERNFGVYGESETNSGVYGKSEKGFGVYGVSSDKEGFGVASGGNCLVNGYLNVNEHIECKGLIRTDKCFICNGDSKALSFIPLLSTENLSATNFFSDEIKVNNLQVVSKSQGQKEINLYCEGSSEVWFSDYGFGKIYDLSQIIYIDRLFAQTVNLVDGRYHVFLQAYGDADIYVSLRTPTHFVVKRRDKKGGSPLEFSYRLVAKRLDYEKKRLESIP